ncbi:MAG: thiamine-phosphate kinase [Chloroflexi bacterium]|nr:thiamine-phosphate kinase [Chloroflexota bacterium]
MAERLSPTLRDTGEFGLIARIRDVLGGEPPSGALGAAPVANSKAPMVPIVGIGDDAAVWMQPAVALVASTDMLVERVHFDLTLMSWRDLGWKALAVNLSDLAAMGAPAEWAFVSLGLRGDTATADVLELYAGMRELAGEAGCTIAGGDTTSVPADMVVSVTVLGSVPAAEADTVLRRDAGLPGDRLAVTGVLGAAAAGLYALRHPQSAPEAQRAPLAVAHRRPRPQLAAGRLIRTAGVRCAMDVSDGLLADLEKLCAASSTGAVVRADLLPLHPAARQAYPDRALAWAAGGGEDYELLFAAPEPVMRRALAALADAGVAATEIGALDDKRGHVEVVDAAGRRVALVQRGWDHFASGAGRTSEHYTARPEPVEGRPSTGSGRAEGLRNNCLHPPPALASRSGNLGAAPAATGPGRSGDRETRETYDRRRDGAPPAVGRPARDSRRNQAAGTVGLFGGRPDRNRLEGPRLQAWGLSRRRPAPLPLVGDLASRLWGATDVVYVSRRRRRSPVFGAVVLVAIVVLLLAAAYLLVTGAVRLPQWELPTLGA